MRKRSKEFHLRLSDEEDEYLKNQARKSGLSRQSFLIAMLKKQTIKEQPHIDFFTVLKALDRIGDNINQIAAKANSINMIDRLEYRKQYDDLKKVTAELLRAVYS